MVVTTEELLKLNKYLTFQLANRLANWINNKYKKLDENNLNTREVILNAVKNDEITYNNKKGSIIGYIKLSIIGDINRYILNNNEINITDISVITTTNNSIIPIIDFNNLSNKDLTTLYNELIVNKKMNKNIKDILCKILKNNKDYFN